MTRKLLPLLLIAAAPSWAAITFVQGKAFDASSGAFPSAVTAGNLLVVVVANTNSTNTSANTWHVGDTVNGASSYAGVASNSLGGHVGVYNFFYKANTAGGANTVSMGSGSSGVTSIYIAEFSGAATSSPLDATVANANGSSSDPTASALTPTVAGDLVVGFAMVSGSVTSGHYQTGWKDFYGGTTGTVTSDGYMPIWIVDSTTAAETAKWTDSQSTWDAAAISLKASGGGGGTTVIPRMTLLGVGP